MAYLKPGGTIPEKGKGSKISNKMRLFVQEYFLDMNATAAVLRAGYKTNNPNRMGAELLCHPLIVLEIEKRLQERDAKTEVKAEYLIQKLFNIIEDTEKNNPTAALRAIELAGKSIALWKERQEITGADGSAIQMEQKVKNDAADFTSRLSRLARTAGTGTVSQFPKPEGEGGT